MPTLSISDNLIAKNIKSPVKLSSLTYDDAYLNQILLVVFKLIGLNPDHYPKGVDSKILNNFIITTYPNLTADEIRIAFELALKKEYEVDLKHFQNFSPLYLSNVIHEYIEYRKKVVKELNKLRMIEEVKKPELTPEQIELNNKKFDFYCIYQPFIKYVKTKELDFGSVSINRIFERLETDLKVLVISNDKKKHIRDSVEKNIKHKVLKSLTETDNKKVKEELRKILKGNDKLLEQHFILEDCRRIAIRQFFQDQINNKVDIIKLLQLENHVKKTS